MDTFLPSAESALVVVDVQPRLLGLIPAPRADRLVQRVRVLIQSAHQLGVPVMLLEQDPDRHGHTLPAIQAELAAAAAHNIVKHHFSAVREDPFLHALNALRRRRVVICGMQAHQCVFFTARDLILEGFITHVPRDCVLSLHPEDELAGLELMQQAGVVITTIETVVIDWLGTSTHPAFHDVIARLP